MIVIGADTHKSAHALAAVKIDTGQLLGERDRGGRPRTPGRGALGARAGRGDRVAIEDCRHVSTRFEAALVTAGEGVVRVAPKLMGESRRDEREPGKSDQIDARSIARAVLKHGLERFPPAFLDEHALEIRLLCDHRETLVKERTRLIPRLRWHLVILDSQLEAKIPKRKLDYPGQVERVNRRLRALPQSARVRIALEEVKRIRAITKDVEELKRELGELIKAHRPVLLAYTRWGPLMAAILIGQTAGAERFKTDAHFASIAGAAPIPVSSGLRQRHRMDRGGNRQLNRALHVIALDPRPLGPRDPRLPRAQEAEGKSRREAIRCLERQLARRYHHLLAQPPAGATVATPIARTPQESPLRANIA